MEYQKVIKVNLALVLIMAIAGLAYGFMTGSKSLITDGVVSTVIFISSSLGLYIHRQLKPNNLKLYPYGKWRFEYIYNLFRLLTLFAIIIFSFFEANFTIYHYINNHVIPPEIVFSEIAPYFVIKLSVVAIAIWWLKSNYKRGYITKESYSMEHSSVVVDGVLTLAILLGILIFSKIPPIEEVADACTLLIVAVILAISIFGELRHLVYIMIGRRMFVEEEMAIKELIENKYQHIHVADLYVEKQGLVTMIYIHCSFDEKLSSDDLVKFEREIKNLLHIMKYEKPKLHFYFVK